MNSVTTNREPITNRLLNQDLSKFALRVSLGIVLITHSIYLKLLVFTLPGTAQYFTSIGLPGVLAYIVFFVEALAGVALVIGYKTRIFAALVIPVLLGAVWVHAGNGWLFSNKGGGWEFPLLLVIMAFSQLGLGNGKYAIQK